MADFLAALMAAVLGGMGVGGGSLFMLWLIFMKGMEQRTAQGINLLFFLVSGAAALLIHAGRRKLPWGLIGLLILAGSAGALLGSLAAGIIDPALLRHLFAFFLTLAGALTLFRKT